MPMKMSVPSLEVLADNLPHGAVYRLRHEVDGARRFEYVSRGIEELFQLSRESLLADAAVLYGMVHQEDIAAAIEAERRSTASGEIFHHVCRFRMRDSAIRWVEWVSRPSRHADGALIFDGVCIDVTERKLAEEALKKNEAALRESEARLKAVSRSALDAIIMMDQYGCISFWNEAAVRMFGFTESEALGRDLHETICPPKYKQRFEAGIRRFLESGDGPVIGKVVELSALKRGGEEFPIEISVSGVMQGGTWNAVAVVRDISERKQAEEERMRSIMRHIFDVIFVVDGGGKILYQNDAAEKILGYTREKYLNTCILDNLGDAECLKAGEAFARIAATRGHREVLECRVRHADGSWRVMESNAVNISENGETRIVLDCRDVTDRVVTLEEAQFLARTWNETFDAISDSVCLLDRNLKILRHNKASYKYAHSQGSLIGLNCNLVFHGTEEPMKPCLFERMKKSMKRESIEIEWNDRWLEKSVHPVFDERGELKGIVHILRDISREKEDELALIKSEASSRDMADELSKANVELRRANERLQKLDRQRREFFSAVGHELRTPIAVTIGAVESMVASIPAVKKSELGVKFVGIAQRNIVRLGRLVENLLDLARSDEGRLEVRPERMDVTQLVRHAVESFTPLAQKSEKQISFVASPEAIFCDVDADKIVQIMGNLLDNAVRFSRNSVDVELSAEETFAEIRVGDDGAGIAPENLSKIFEKYFRADSPEAKSHIGLGLSIVKLLAEAHGGSVSVANRDRGAVFSVRIPRSAKG